MRRKRNLTDLITALAMAAVTLWFFRAEPLAWITAGVLLSLYAVAAFTVRLWQAQPVIHAQTRTRRQSQAYRHFKRRK